MTRRSGTASLCVASLSLLLFLLATDSLEGLHLLHQPLDPLKDGHLIRHRILAHLKELAANYKEVPATHTLSYPATGSWRTTDEKGRTDVILQFPCSLQALKSGWDLEKAMLQGPNLRENTCFGNCTLPNITLDFTNSLEEAMQGCKESSESYRFSLKVSHEDLFGRNGDGNVCFDEATRLQLVVSLKEPSHERRRIRRSHGPFCDRCRPRPFRVNLSEFVNGFHPHNVGPDGRAELYYCVGDCIHADCLDDPTPWLLLAILMHNKNTAFHAPSCDPVAFTNMTGVLVHPDHSQPCIHNITNLVVTKCRCL